MTIYLLFIINGSFRWVDSIWCSRESCNERQKQVVESLKVGCSHLPCGHTCAIAEMKLEDGRMADPETAS